MSSQEIYARLLLRNDDAKSLDFNVIAFLCVLPDGSLDQQKLKDLIKIFRPGRDGKLLLLDFVKSIDEVYREIRMLRASVANSMKVIIKSCIPTPTAMLHLTSFLAIHRLTRLSKIC